jgi:hypothetical protein
MACFGYASVAPPRFPLSPVFRFARFLARLLVLAFLFGLSFSIGPSCVSSAIAAASYLNQRNRSASRMFVLRVHIPVHIEKDGSKKLERRPDLNGMEICTAIPGRFFAIGATASLA